MTKPRGSSRVTSLPNYGDAEEPIEDLVEFFSDVQASQDRASITEIDADDRSFWRYKLMLEGQFFPITFGEETMPTMGDHCILPEVSTRSNQELLEVFRKAPLPCKHLKIARVVLVKDDQGQEALAIGQAVPPFGHPAR
jgi:hypothetical protein